MLYNPFKMQQAWNVGKIVGAGKLVETAMNVFL